MKKIKSLLTSFLTLMLIIVCVNTISFAQADEEKSTNNLVYNSAEDFSELGSDFWNYYFINSGEYGEFTPLVVNGTGLFGNYYPDGSYGFEYRYCVHPSDFTSNEYHQYLEVWGGVYLHPGFKADAVLSFVAPVDGVINIESTIKAMDAESNGVKIYTSLNNAANFIKVNGNDFIVHNAMDTQYKIENLDVKCGDEIYFRVNCNDELRFDLTYFSPTITYVSYQMPDDMDIIISDESLTVQEGGIRLLETSMNINLGNELNYVYTSSDENVVKVLDNGLVYALKKGSATISVTIEGSDYSAQCNVNVISEVKSNSSNLLWLIPVVCVGCAAIVCAIILAIRKKRK